ncbi:hypothetical protein DRJ16_02805 [Candidatus Woesearchaeota archaeon]|nr:MAG: hypothetical protein DRJ16_02805 [Candidatus Woesearchaeota archaeon]
MTQIATIAFSQSDLRLVIEHLRDIYINRKKILTYTLYGEPVLRPHPYTKIGGRKIRGPPISESYLRSFDIVEHYSPVIAVDASIKTLLNLGSFRIVVSKVVAGLWKGIKRKALLGPYKRIRVIEDKEEAGEWLLRLELEIAIKAARRFEARYCLLDRSLVFPPSLKESTFKLAQKLDNLISAKNGYLVGVVKSSKLSLNTGESLIGYLISMAGARLRGLTWYYHPVFREHILPDWFIGDIVVARLSESIENALRIDISRKTLRKIPLERIIGELAFMQDIATPGYPYPLKAVHNLATISDSELQMDKIILLDILEKEGLGKCVFSSLSACNFREKYFWGDGI